MLFIAFAIVPAQVHADFNFPDFSSTTGINLVGTAAQVGNALRLTPSQPSQVGAAWFDTKQLIQDGFTTSFQFQITQLGYSGADGFAFVIQNSSLVALGPQGSGLGYGNYGGGGGIPNSLAVEFDTYQLFNGDPDGNHIAVHSLGTLPNDIRLASRLGITSAIPNLSDGNIHTVRIDYVPGTMKIFLDDLVNSALTVAVDLAAILSLDAGSAFVGFTAATGGEFENHDILNWSFSIVSPVVEVDIDIKPGSDPNCFNNDGHGVIPVAILGSADFDVTEIDTTLLALDGFAVRVRGNKGPLCSVEYSNADTYPDLVCHFEDSAPGNWTTGNDDATLTGFLLDGTEIEGTDSICVVPRQ
jgi:hypothetical protein